MDLEDHSEVCQVSKQNCETLLLPSESLDRKAGQIKRCIKFK